jgi:hypothetical protein
MYQSSVTIQHNFYEYCLEHSWLQVALIFHIPSMEHQWDCLHFAGVA